MDSYDDDINGRSRWLRIGGGVLGGVVLLAAGFGVGRLSAPAATGGGQQHASVNGQSGPGPTRVENGVPVGYAHTQEGAVAAATNFVSVVDGPMIVQPDKYRKAIVSLAAPEASSQLQSEGEKTMASLQNVSGLATYAQQGRTIVFRTVPLSYRVESYDESAAQVSIWTEGLLAVDGVLPPRQTWTTVTTTVKWVDGDWKLIRIGAYAAGSEGPVPAVTQPSAQAPALPPQLKDFKEYRQDVAT
jgi:hypothetical protein